MDNIIIYKLLTEIKIFDNVKIDTIKDISKKAKLNFIKNQKILFLEGNNVDRMFFILEGRAIVSRFSNEGEEKIIHILGKGDFINDMSLDNKKTSTTILITENSKILSFNKENILKWMKEDFEFNMLIINSLAGKLRKSYRQIRNLGLKKINSRIISRLLKLGRDYGLEDDNKLIITLDLTHHQLAAMVGSTRESVSRFLKKLEREGLIKQSNKGIIILDLEGLKEYDRKL